MSDPISYGNFDAAFLDELVSYLGDKRVLEVFAGNGLLAHRLTERGVSIIATTRFASHDGHTYGMYHQVEELEATAAVRKYRDQTDILLMSWPTATEGATSAALAWGADRPIVFIGEVTDLSRGNAGLGGCASDLFFDLTNEGSAFQNYSPRNQLERATIFHLDRDRVAAWRARDYEPPGPLGFRFR